MKRCPKLLTNILILTSASILSIYNIKSYNYEYDSPEYHIPPLIDSNSYPQSCSKRSPLYPPSGIGSPSLCQSLSTALLFNVIPQLS